MPPSPRALLGTLTVLLLLLVLPAVFIPRACAQTTRCVSLSSTQEQGNQTSDDASVSADGRFVAYQSIATNLVPGDTNDRADVFVLDLVSGRRGQVTVVRGAEGPVPA